MQCALSGTTTTEPVVSIKSGHVFDKQLLEKYLSTHDDKCPITGVVLTRDTDIIPLVLSTTTTTAPQSTTTSSIPSMIKSLQSEWDALMLETFTLKTTLAATRQELSQALYAQDAASRVIARLLAEKESWKANAASSSSAAMDVVVSDEKSLSKEVLDTLSATQEKLSALRKEQSSGAKFEKDFEIMKKVSSHTPHRSDKPGINCVALHPTLNHLTLTGGVDGVAKIFDQRSKRVSGTLPHSTTSEVTSVAWHPSEVSGSDLLLFTASKDGVIKTWQSKSSSNTKKSSSYESSHVFQHRQSVTDIDVHPAQHFLGSVDATGCWSLWDIRSAEALITSPTEDNANSESACFAFHPDGGIAATGTSVVTMYDVKTCTSVATFNHNASSSQCDISSISFSRNGYHMISTCASTGDIVFYDLRKLKSFTSIKTDGVPVNAGTYDDASGSVIAAAVGHTVSLFQEVKKKKWQVVKTFEDHTATVTDVAVANDVAFVASTSLDRSLKYYA